MGVTRLGASRGARLRRDVAKNGPLFLMTVPGLVLLGVFAYLPMPGITLAFKDYKFTQGILGSHWVGFRNSEFLFASGSAVTIIRNTQNH